MTARPANPAETGDRRAETEHPSPETGDPRERHASGRPRRRTPVRDTGETPKGAALKGRRSSGSIGSLRERARVAPAQPPKVHAELGSCRELVPGQILGVVGDERDRLILGHPDAHSQARSDLGRIALCSRELANLLDLRQRAVHASSMVERPPAVKRVPREQTTRPTQNARTTRSAVRLLEASLGAGAGLVCARLSLLGSKTVVVASGLTVATVGRARPRRDALRVDEPAEL